MRWDIVRIVAEADIEVVAGIVAEGEVVTQIIAMTKIMTIGHRDRIQGVGAGINIGEGGVRTVDHHQGEFFLPKN